MIGLLERWPFCVQERPRQDKVKRKQNEGGYVGRRKVSWYLILL